LHGKSLRGKELRPKKMRGSGKSPRRKRKGGDSKKKNASRSNRNWLSKRGSERSRRKRPRDRG